MFNKGPDAHCDPPEKLPKIRVFRYQKGTWTGVELEAEYSVSTTDYKTIRLQVPIPRGSFDVAITFSSIFCIFRDSKFYGMLAADPAKAKLDIGGHHNTTVTDFNTQTSNVHGSVEATMNNRKLKPGHSFIRDCSANCVVHAVSEGDFSIDLPCLQMGGDYNYTRQYQSFDWYHLYMGDLSIDISPSEVMRPRKFKRLERWIPAPHPERKPDKQTPAESGLTNLEVSYPEGKQGEQTSPGRASIERLHNLDYNSEEDIADDIIPGSRMKVPDEFVPKKATQEEKEHLLRDRGVYTTLVEPQHSYSLPPKVPEVEDPDPWAMIQKAEGTKSVAGESQSRGSALGGGSIRVGSLKPPIPPPTEKVGSSLNFTHYEDPGTPIRAQRDPVLRAPPTGETSSLRSTLTGGSLKTKTDQRLAQLTTAERTMYEYIKRSQGKTRANEYLQGLNK